MSDILKSIGVSAVALSIFVMLALPSPAISQDVSTTEETKTFTQEQLAQLLAPIALYPDELIAQVLLASTYPLEIVMADRWVQQNKDLKGKELADALEQETWDPSVKALVNFPTVLSMLSQKLDMTTKFGDAFLEQKEDVMEVIQELRKKAADAGNLKSTREQKVVVEADTITIEPTDSRIIYVPTYDPFVVYGPWWYPAYPPYYFYPRPYPGVVFSFGIGVTLGLPWGYAWGGWDWHNHTVYININRNLSHNRYIDRNRYIRHYERSGQPSRGDRMLWSHDPFHRRGVAYKDKTNARKFGQLPSRPAEPRTESRGFRTPRYSEQTTHSGGTSVDRGSRVVVPPVGGTQKIKREKKLEGRTPPPEASGESVFTGGSRGTQRVRESSERGKQSVGRGNVYRSRNATQPVTRPAIEVPRTESGNRGGESMPHKGKRGDNDRR